MALSFDLILRFFFLVVVGIVGTFVCFVVDCWLFLLADDCFRIVYTNGLSYRLFISRTISM